MISQVIEVPSPLGLRPSGLEDAPDALRRAGLHERLGSADAVRIDVPSYDAVRDPETGILNPHGITAVARDVANAVDATLDAGRFPVLLGGDCSIILGPLLALRRRGRMALPSWTVTPTSSIPATSRTVRSHRSTWRWQRDAVPICSRTSMGCGR
jgi:arginase family enzyme